MQTEAELKEIFLDRKANYFDPIYNYFGPKMYPICLRFARSKDDAEDILQESFIKVFEKRKQFSGVSPLGAWIRKIVVNTSLNYVKKEYKNNYSDKLDLLHDYEKESIIDPNIQSDTILIELMQNLPDGYRTVFNLYVFEEMSHNEIGEALNISESTSKSQLSRARKQLQKHITKQDILNLSE